MSTLYHRELLENPELFNRMNILTERAKELYRIDPTLKNQDTITEMTELGKKAAALIDTLAIIREGSKK
jgi:hypothetical protein